MLQTKLDDHAPLTLAFHDSTGCRKWLDRLPLTNIHYAQELLAAQYAGLRTADVSPLERLRMLEMLRDPAAFVQSEAAKKFAGKPLPLDDAETTVWTAVIGLWQDAAANYELCLNAYRDGDLAIAPYAALVTMRCLQLTGAVLFDHYRIYREAPGAIWRALHELYNFAEQHGYARIRVQDSFNRHDPDSSCTEAYLEALLAHLANPFALSVRQMNFVKRWLEKWSALVGLSAQPAAPGPIPPLQVDLHSQAGVTFAESSAERTPSVRYLDLEQLSKTLRQTINLLKQGQLPGQLGLGEDARQPGCENLLMVLYVQWCRSGTSRGETRAQVTEEAKVGFGLPSAHFHVNGGRPFRQPGELTAREKQDLDRYGYITRVHHETGSEDQADVETWQILNQSASGFMCMQRDPAGRHRIGHNQLIVVRRASGQHYRLGMVQWLRVEENNTLSCGVRLFPGTASAVAVRPSNFNPAGSSRFERALLLPEIPAPTTPSTIVLPAGWFQTGRFIELFSDRKQIGKLLNLLEKGRDFDRGTITLV